MNLHGDWIDFCEYFVITHILPWPMIKILKLQKAVIAFILGVIALIAYIIMSKQEMEESRYLLSIAGALFMVGALLFLYPILFSKKDKSGRVELDPELKAKAESNEPTRLADE